MKRYWRRSKQIFEGGFPNADSIARELREVRNLVTIALFAQEEDLEKVTAAVDELFTLLQRSYKR